MLLSVTVPRRIRRRRLAKRQQIVGDDSLRGEYISDDAREQNEHDGADENCLAAVEEHRAKIGEVGVENSDVCEVVNVAERGEEQHKRRDNAEKELKRNCVENGSLASTNQTSTKRSKARGASCFALRFRMRILRVQCLITAQCV